VLRCNAEMPSAVQRATCKLDSLGERTLANRVEQRPRAGSRSRCHACVTGYSAQTGGARVASSSATAQRPATRNRHVSES
jgi:hypothetical protein